MGVDLSMAGLRLAVESAEAEHVDHVVAAMGASCECTPSRPGADWTLLIEFTEVQVGVCREWPRLELRPGGPALTVNGNHHGTLRALGYYRPQAEPVSIEVDRGLRTTRVVVSSAYTDQTHWLAWLTKVFFASRLLAAGWRMLHASAVVVDGDAVVFVAASGGGKSTLAHRACRELGARFLADDLALIGPEGTVVGWPTRVCLPYRLDAAAPTQVGRMHNGSDGRRRLVVSLTEHRSLGIDHAPPAPLGSVVHVRPGVGKALAAHPWSSQSWAAAEASASDIPVQRLYTSDLLGLMGGPATLDPDDRPGVFAEAAGVELVVPDPTGLPTAPVWETLAEALPLMREAVV